MALLGEVGTVGAMPQGFWGQAATATDTDRYVRWVRVELVREGTVTYRARPMVNNAEHAATVLVPLLSREPSEVFVACLLDARHRLTALHRCGQGCVSSVCIEPRAVFTAALLGNAVAVIVAHNHPSGDPEPSREDALLTERLVAAGRLLGVPVLDHLVIGDGAWRSVRDSHPDLWQGGDA